MFLVTFLLLAAPSVRDRGRIELPFGRGKTSPVAAADIARVVAASSPILRRTSVAYTNSQVRGRRTWMRLRESFRTR